jgi:hypothetical protein
LHILDVRRFDRYDSWRRKCFWNEYYTYGQFIPHAEVLDSFFTFVSCPDTTDPCGNPVIGVGVEVRGIGELRSLVPMLNPMSLVRETTICSDTRPVMTNKVKAIKPRKNPRPNESRNRVQDIVFPFY